MQIVIDTKVAGGLWMRRSKAKIAAAARKAGSTALRDMRAEATKRIRKRKKLKAREIRKALILRRAKGSNIESMEWAVDVTGKRVPLSAYPHRQTKAGVSVQVNQGKRSVIRSAFVATMRSGHRGIFIRRGSARLPIVERFGSRPSDALRHAGEAEGVAARGSASFRKRFAALMKAK